MDFSNTDTYRGYNMEAAGRSICYDLLTHPARAMVEAARLRTVGLAFVVLAGAVLSLNAAGIILDAPHAPTAAGVSSKVAWLVMQLGMVIALWITFSVVCNGMAGLLGGRPNGSACMAVSGLASAPLLLTAPAANILSLATPEASSLVYGLGILPVLCLWTFVLVVKGLCRACELTATAAIVCALVPPCLVAGGSLATGILGFSYLYRLTEGIDRLIG